MNIFFHSFLACRVVSAEKPAVSPMGFLCMLFCYSSLAAFNIFSLCLIFVSFMNMFLGLFLFEFIMYETLWTSWILVDIFCPMLGKFLTTYIISSNIFSHPFFFWYPYNSNVVSNIVPEVSENVLNYYYYYFCFILLLGSYFYHFIFQLTYLFFCFSYSTIDSF